jgi:hypothetical protein
MSQMVRVIKECLSSRCFGEFVVFGSITYLLLSLKKDISITEIHRTNKVIVTIQCVRLILWYHNAALINIPIPTLNHQFR